MSPNNSRITLRTPTSPRTPSSPQSYRSSRSSPQSPTSSSGGIGGAIKYRVERQTVFITTDIPPAQWDTNHVNQIFETMEGSDAQVRRSKSLSDTRIFVVAENDSHSPAPETHYRPSRQSVRVDKLLRPPTVYNIGSGTTPPSSPLRQVSRPRILFYHSHDPHYGFTNFSAHDVWYKGKRYPTSEHLFQSFKFQDHRPNLAEHIRVCSERPSVALSEARRFQPEVRSDWKRVNIQMMDEALFYKFSQHTDLKAELLGTGEAELIEDSDKDSFWGVGADRRGRNELGKALERLRAKFRDGSI